MKRGIVAAAIATLAFACGGRDVAPFAAALDALPLPSTWRIAQTITESQDGAEGCIEMVNAKCPSVTRYFVVTGGLTDLLMEAKRAAAAGGFTNIEVTHPDCDVISSGPPCSLVATNDEMRIDIGIYPPGRDVDGLGLATPDQATVRMIAWPN